MALNTPSHNTATKTTVASSPRIDWAPLIESLRGAEQLSQQFLALLQQERKSLELRDYGTFEQLLGKKNQLVTLLQQNTIERHHWLQQRGFHDDAEALASVEAQAPGLARKWHSLADLWRECQYASSVNDQISQRTRAAVGRILDVLSGNAGQGSTYDGKGGTQRMQTGRTITSA